MKKVIWLTGLPCSGKTTLANELHWTMRKLGIKSYVLDGDNIRNTHISSDVGFSLEDRAKHLYRVAEIAKILIENDVWAICAFVSPIENQRNYIKERIIGEDNFILVYLECGLTTCIQRDDKGMYARAKKGEIKDFTGIDSPYEEPEHPNILVYSDVNSVEKCVSRILEGIVSFVSR